MFPLILSVYGYSGGGGTKAQVKEDTGVNVVMGFDYSRSEMSFQSWIFSAVMSQLFKNSQCETNIKNS